MPKHVFVDYENQGERELGIERFSLSAVDADGDWTDLLRTDDWEAVLKAVREHVGKAAPANHLRPAMVDSSAINSSAQSDISASSCCDVLILVSRCK